MRRRPGRDPDIRPGHRVVTTAVAVRTLPVRQPARVARRTGPLALPPHEVTHGDVPGCVTGAKTRAGRRCEPVRRSTCGCRTPLRHLSCGTATFTVRAKVRFGKLRFFAEKVEGDRDVTASVAVPAAWRDPCDPASAVAGSSPVGAALAHVQHRAGSGRGPLLHGHLSRWRAIVRLQHRCSGAITMVFPLLSVPTICRNLHRSPAARRHSAGTRARRRLLPCLP